MNEKRKDFMIFFFQFSYDVNRKIKYIEKISEMMRFDSRKIKNI